MLAHRSCSPSNYSVNRTLTRYAGSRRLPQALAFTWESSVRYQGRITEWRDEQGYGFITPNGGGERVFLHVRSFKSRSCRPGGNELVKFELATDERGRPRAEQVEYVSLRPQPKASGGTSIPLLLLAGLFLVAVCTLAVAAKIPWAVFFVYLGLSVLTFVSYAADKSAAKEGQWRTKESTLQLFALLGGWPGGLAAQQLLRHKSKKQSFQFVFWLSVTVNIVVLGWLLSTDGSHFLANIMAGKG